MQYKLVAMVTEFNQEEPNHGLYLSEFPSDKLLYIQSIVLMKCQETSSSAQMNIALKAAKLGLFPPLGLGHAPLAC